VHPESSGSVQHAGPFRPPSEPFKPPASHSERNRFTAANVAHSEPPMFQSTAKGKGKAVEFDNEPRRRTFHGFKPEVRLPSRASIPSSTRSTVQLSENLRARVPRASGSTRLTPGSLSARKARNSLPNLAASAFSSRTLSTGPSTSAQPIDAPIELDISADVSHLAATALLSERSHHLALSLGIKLLAEQMAKNHGFDKDVAMQMVAATGDFQQTDEALRRMREAAELQARQLLEPEHDDGTETQSLVTNQPEDDLESNGVDDVALPGTQPEERPGHLDESGPRSARVTRGRPSNVSHDYGLVWTPAEIEPADLTMQTPPPQLRASIFAREAKQARLSRIVDRESISPRRDQLQLDMAKHEAGPEVEDAKTSRQVEDEVDDSEPAASVRSESPVDQGSSRRSVDGQEQFAESDDDASDEIISIASSHSAPNVPSSPIEQSQASLQMEGVHQEGDDAKPRRGVRQSIASWLFGS
jgi:hypothetical protein